MQTLYAANVEVVLNGHDHDYERFAPQDPSGKLDLQRGIREFVVGTGGKNSHRTFASAQPNSDEVHQADTVWSPEIDASPHELPDWEFVPEAGKDASKTQAAEHATTKQNRSLGGRLCPHCDQSEIYVSRPQSLRGGTADFVTLRPVDAAVVAVFCRPLWLPAPTCRPDEFETGWANAGSQEERYSAGGTQAPAVNKCTDQGREFLARFPRSWLDLDPKHLFADSCLVILVNPQGCAALSSPVKIGTAVKLEGLPWAIPLRCKLYLAWRGPEILAYGLALTEPGNVWGVEARGRASDCTDR